MKLIKTVQHICQVLCRKVTYTWPLKREILRYYRHLPKNEIDSEKREALSYLKHNKLSIIPYLFTKQYKESQIPVFCDESIGLKYVLHQDKRLYFKRGWSDELIQYTYNFLRVEQDSHSPHCYLSPSFDVTDGDVVLDIGAAEANFSLSIIEKAKKIYIFEADAEWNEPLSATFAPWKEKVVVINKYVSNQDSTGSVRLDSQYDFSEAGPLFIKIDVEGAEKAVLEGAKELLFSDNAIKIAICTYHNQQDEAILSSMMKKIGYAVEPSQRYILNYFDQLAPPYFRRGLIRCSNCK